AALKARHEWAEMPFHARASIFLKAAELISTSMRATVNAATMLNLSKNAFQAEIDSACELADFLRFNAYYAEQIYSQQPMYSTKGIWNYVEHRPLDGFVFAATPFNFTAISLNLPSSPAIMGNTVIWKPASSAVFSGYWALQALKAAGLPDGVINMVAGSGAEVGDPIIDHPDLAGIHFTGSTRVFQSMWSKIGRDIAKYRNYPRLVGETGGKDFIFIHPDADIHAAGIAIVRGSFEYQGQKCSAASRVYVPKSRWPQLKEIVCDEMASIRMGGVEDFRNYVNAVIDRGAFANIKDYINHAKNSTEAKIAAGGNWNDSTGYFIQPTMIEAMMPRYKSMTEEIFGPVVSVYAYEDSQLDQALELCDTTSPYSLTGSVFATDRRNIEHVARALRNASGNFYINDKPTGAVVGQQPFGGARASGTNDKAGSMLNLLRWVSPRAVKETFVPPHEYAYPFMAEE
ncbi:MAG: L-glutamate gamma-semialdehyde dehydrogenase, partial [Elusimicrobia bacterium]|nr:L-glutamate gamma-semialdehyde dehydrogenase [Elusimicrobiota bacterium]